MRLLHKDTYQALIEAVRRYQRFSEGEPLHFAWVGLGYKKDYQRAIQDGYMKWAHGEPRKRTMGWLRLTEKGVLEVQKMINEGFTYSSIEQHEYPSDRYVE